MRTSLLLMLSSVIILGGEVMARDKVVVIPLNSTPSNDKLWGQGRPGAELLLHKTESGYCTSWEGINFALSKNLVTWDGSQSVCPSHTWVCRNEDLSLGLCDVGTVSTFQTVDCDGTVDPATISDLTAIFGWVADAGDHVFGDLKKSDNLTIDWSDRICESYHVWCCWK